MDIAVLSKPIVDRQSGKSLQQSLIGCFVFGKIVQLNQCSMSVWSIVRVAEVFGSYYACVWC